MIQLVRQQSFPYSFSQPLSQRRGFYFQLQVGFTKELDPLSGMTVNLVSVDRWLRQFIDEIIPAEKPEFDDPDALRQATRHGHFILRRAVEFFQASSAKVGAELTQVKLQEERHWSLAWTHEGDGERLLFTSSHYLENFGELQTDLLRISLTWLQSVGDSFDLSRESLELLKGLSARKLRADESAAEFQKLLGRELSPGTCLVGVDVENLSRGYKLSY